MRRIIIKEGPIVFLRDVFVMEVLATLIFFGASFLANYEMLYRSYSLSEYLRYDLFTIIVFSFFQLTYISILFLNWYFSHYEIMEKEIIKKSGLLFRRRKSVSMFEVASVELYQSPLGRMMHHATIILEHNNGRVTKIKNISNYDEYVHVIKQMAHSASGRILTRDPRILIEEGEGLFLEFKETLRYDTRKGEVSKEIEKMVLKTIVGFLNADGGTLLIGVNDDGNVIGLENDFKSLPKKNRDGFENHLNMLIKTMIGLSFAKYTSVKFEKVDDRDICLITVREGHKPAYLINGDKKEDFYVRVGNSTQPFSMSETSDYIKTHWG
ncbi:MAG: putative DNA binding domain-containing protein [bacterium]|nr:putative DNA binding domain-containing protein [bacterium]